MTKKQLYRPIATWTGKLILPTQKQRKSDGGVFLEIQNAPSAYRHLKGKKCWFCIHEKSMSQQWFADERFDMNFTAETIKSSKANKFHPHRVNGWENVSPLETIAGGRPDDDVHVLLKKVEVNESGEMPTIQSFYFPSEISGSVKALVQFTKNVDVEKREMEVIHYNPESKKFDGKVEWISITESVVREDLNKPQQTLDQIHLSSLNKSGWYIFGHQEQTKFTLHALEPRALLLLQIDEYLVGQQNIDPFIDQDNWKDCYQGFYKRTMIDADGSLVQSMKPNETLQQRMDQVYVEGNQSLFVHVFGWIKNPNPDIFIKSGIVMGHFALGIATVVKDDFTGELRWDVEYKQVYVHNVEGIISSSLKWHTYMGSIKRGWMSLIPISDIIIHHPSLSFQFHFGERSLSPLEMLEDHLDRIMARIRSGSGTGLTAVNLATSCVQDSALGLYTTIRDFENQIKENINVQQWLEKNQEDEQVKMLEALHEISQALDKFLRPFHIVPARWYFHEKRIKFSLPIHLTQFVDALLTNKTILPRSAHDGIAKVMAKKGALLWVVRTDQIGGVLSDHDPLYPTTITKKHPPKSILMTLL